jgi:1-pyrroline-5-carboxylate dehydrogenase
MKGIIAPRFAGIHFTGSRASLKVWTQIGANINTHKTYPRIVGETGGKTSSSYHASATPEQVAKK